MKELRKNLRDLLKELKVYIKNKYIRFKENTIYGKRNNFPNYD